MAGSPKDITKLDSRDFIVIKGAAVHNLKRLDVAIPRNKFVVVTGLSGSGKSSLAFDTLYAEGQRRYVESLSSYARQFIGRMDKPEVDYILGISPAVAIQQKVISRNPRSTVGTSTEIYDYLKLLYARIGKTYSPLSGLQVRKHSVADVVDVMCSNREGRYLILAPLMRRPDRSLGMEYNFLLQRGFTRVLIGDEIKEIEELSADTAEIQAAPAVVEKKPKGRGKKKTVDEESQPGIRVLEQPVAEPGHFLVVDRIALSGEPDEELLARMADSVQTAFREGAGSCLLRELKSGSTSIETAFSNRFELDGISFEEPSVHLFSFNNPFGACRCCEGFGSVMGIDEDLVVPDKSLSVYEGAIVCWKGEKMREWNDQLIKNAHKFDFPVHKPYYELSDFFRQLLWKGNKHFYGLDRFFKFLEEQTYKIQYRVMLSRYRGKTACPECMGTRLRKDASYVKVAGASISDLVLMPVKDVLAFFENMQLDDNDQRIAKRLLLEINSRLKFLNEVGLGYLTLNRLSNSLSGGESQRINLATSLGSTLVGSMYILDEPSIGLHPRDTRRLIDVLKSLRDVGNTVIVVEHDEEIMRAADQLIDIGPMAGAHGGELVFQGHADELMRNGKSLTALYLSGKESIPVPAQRRKWKKSIDIKGARENNLKHVNVRFPIGIMTVVTGVSGSGKTSLVKKILYPAVKKVLGGYGEATGNFDRMEGDYLEIKACEMVDQNPIGKSSRSNPVTYIKAYDDVRSLYSDLPLARQRALKPSHFSFNVEGGRCEQCQGEGMITVEMQFMADIHLKCDQCKGRRFKEQVLSVEYRGKSVFDILELTVDQALEFFSEESGPEKYKSIHARICNKIQPLADVGLGYIRLGQSSSTLSGGEAQRIKLASFLSKGNQATNTLFVFDEPTTGLHFHDIRKLLKAFDALVRNGNTLVVIEHNQEVIKCADWVIDLGPDGGQDGGRIVFEGLPEQLVDVPESLTGQCMRDKVVHPDSRTVR
ncbi:MAG: excinuclease subunit [Bacteroidota bacterium]